MSLYDTLGLPGNSQNKIIGSPSIFDTQNNTTLQPAGGGIQSQPTSSSSPSPLQTQYNLYNQGVQQQAGDYDSIMQGYKDLYNKAASMPAPQTVAASNYVAQNAKYNESSDLAGAIANLQNLASTGGYSSQDIADLRARGVSPIRSVYSSAQSNIDRAKALQGGYSPNYTAATAKMSRDEAQQIADATQNVNAGIAQNVASNKIQIAPTLANTTAGQSDLMNQIGMFNTSANNAAAQFNAGANNDITKFNVQSQLQNPALQTQLAALQGQQGLYGTTPALAALFGQQALQGANLQAGINNQGNQLNANILGQIMPRLG